MQGATAAKKFNIIPGINVPYKLLQDGLTPRMAILGGLFYTFSGKTEKDGTVSTCTRRKKELKRKYRLSGSTLWRGFKRLKGYMSAVEDKDDTYIFDHTAVPELFLRAPDELFDKVFTIKYKAKKNRPERIEIRRLTHNEILVGGYVITQCDNLKKEKKEFETSNSEIAEALNLSEPIVQAALDTLIAAKIVFCKVKGVNRYCKSKYKVHSRFLRKQKQAVTKAQADTPPPQQEPTEKVITFRNKEDVHREQKTAEDREYYRLRHLAEDIADKNYKRAMLVKDFAAAENGLRGIGADLAFAEARNSPNLPELQAREAEYQLLRSMALKRLKMTDDDFNVEKILESVGELNR